MKRMKLNRKKILGLGGLGVAALVLLPALAAFEAHVINVTAQIENGVLVVPHELEFGTTFPQEQLDKNVGISLSESFLDQCTPGSNLITNGDFETPVVVNGAQWDIFPSGTGGLGWTVRWESGQPNTFNSANQPATANLELHRGVAGWLPHAGQQHSELDSDWDGPSGPLNGEPALVNIYQDIPTTVGQQYHLSYFFSPRPGTDASQNVLKVRINGVEIDSHAADGSANANTVWTEYTNDITATLATTRVEFAAAGTPDSLGVFLDDVSFSSLGRVCSVDYVLRQKPKCEDDINPAIHPQVTEVNGVFACPAGSHEMLLLCPFLSKHETTTDGTPPENDGPGINAFHGLPPPWTPTTTVNTEQPGQLQAVQDEQDNWLIDLKTPCFTGQCAQDWTDFVHAQNPAANPTDYQLDPALEHQVFGCDLWFEVISVGGDPNLIVNKVIVGGPLAGNPAAFSFHVDGGAAKPFEADGSNSLVVSPGAHVITEDPEINYLPPVFSGDCDASGNVTVPASGSGTATCTITNTAEAAGGGPGQ